MNDPALSILSAITFGAVTVLAPFVIMQPSIKSAGTHPKVNEALAPKYCHTPAAKPSKVKLARLIPKLLTPILIDFFQDIMSDESTTPWWRETV